MTKIDFGSSLAAGRLSPEIRADMADLPLQDLLDKDTGMYTLLKDDGVSGHWGLDAIMARCEIAPKPYEKLVDDNGVYQAERVVFADTGTGATMMMLTQIPYSEESGDELNYFGKANWNADGKVMLFSRSVKADIWGPRIQATTEAYGPMLVDADGGRPRIAFGKGRAMGATTCSPKRPEIAYAEVQGRIMELNLAAGKVGKTICKPNHTGRLKVSPDDKYVMGCAGDYFWIHSLSSHEKWAVPLDLNEKTGKAYDVHRGYMFVPGDTDWIIFFYKSGHPGGGGREEGFRLHNFKTGQEHLVPFYFDWCHGDLGRYLGVNPSIGRLIEWTGKMFRPLGLLNCPDNNWTDKPPYYDIPPNSASFGAHWPDDQLWAYDCKYKRYPRPHYLSAINKIFAKPFPDGGRVNRFNICYNNRWSNEDRWGNRYLCHTSANVSPDGTKLLFNSNVFTRTGVFMVVASNPLPPVDVSARIAPDGVEISWKPPKYHSEIAGYHVYRSDQSGKGFKLMSPRVVTGNSFIDPRANPDTPHFYALRSVENSRLESPLSEEATVGPINDAPLRVFCQAEKAISAELDAPSPDAIWMNFDGFASNLYYIWQRRPDKPGCVTMAVNVPRDDQYYIVARMKGRDGATFAIAGQQVCVESTDTWKWARSKKPVTLSAGLADIEIASSKYGSCLDCFYLATDKSFEPTGRIVTESPEPLELSAETDDGLAWLKWSGPKSPRWHHYNLYCSTDKDFTPSQATLIASPDRETYLDWQTEPGPEYYYSVTQVTLDGLESPRSNTAAYPTA